MKRLAMLSLLAFVAAFGALGRWGAALPDPAADRPVFWMAALCLPALLVVPGLGWARYLGRNKPHSGLQQTLDATWMALAMTWLDVAIAREVGFRGLSEALVQGGLALGWTVAGLLLARGAPDPVPTPRAERIGVLAVVVAVCGVAVWRSADIARPLDGGWYLTGADEEGHDLVVIEPGEGWRDVQNIGWPEAGARRLVPSTTHTTLVAPQGATGRLVLAVRGPLGSRIAAAGQENTVAPEMSESPEEGPVRRYLRAGVAGIAVDLQLAPGEALPIEVQGDAVYLLPSTDAVWSLHATGALRYVHYYQLLNQVENQVWAEELLTNRWITLNQPPGWSPILAVATLWVNADLLGSNALFLGVLLLIGCSGVRLLGALAPDAPGPAWGLPAAMVACHGLLMLEPGSANFPDSLYAAAVLGVCGALATGRVGALAGMALAAGLLRYPGAVFAALLVIAWRLSGHPWPRQVLRAASLAAGVGLVGAALFALLGQTEDAAFIVWFETFPEHWHGDYAPGKLLPRIPEFYNLWVRYTGGAVALAVVGAFGRPGSARQGARFLLLGAGLYSGILATVDHFPTHYFLPLVALSGPALGAGAAAWNQPAGRSRALALGLPIAAAVGVAAFLWVAQV